jgi:hypothetical protein
MSIKGIIKKKHCNTIKVIYQELSEIHDRKGNKKEQTLSILFDDHLYFTNTWNEILLDVQAYY